MKSIKVKDYSNYHIGALMHSLYDFHDYFYSSNKLQRYCNLVWGLYHEFIIIQHLKGNFVSEKGMGDFEKNGLYYDIKVTTKDIIFLPCHRVTWSKYDFLLFAQVKEDEIHLLGTLPRKVLLKFPKWTKVNGRYKRAFCERDDKCVYILFLNRLNYGNIP